MIDSEFEEQKARLAALAEKWIGPLGLGWWDITHAYAREEYRAPGTTARDDSLAYCKADWRYGHAEITWNMPNLIGYADADLERAYIHELMHIFLNEMRW